MLFDEYLDIAGNPILAAPVSLDLPQGEAEEHEEHVQELAQYALSRLLAEAGELDSSAPLALLVGLADRRRPGPRYEGDEHELGEKLLQQLDTGHSRCELRWFASGNVAAFAGLRAGLALLEHDATCQCIVGGLDSLLDETTLDWLELKERLKSETFGRNQGLPPGEAAAFFLLESEEVARIRRRKPLAQVCSLGLASEPAPFVEEIPSMAEGLTSAIRQAMAGVPTDASDVDAIFADLNGEFYRAKEWSHASLRCFQHVPQTRALWHPAECFGDIGSAWGAVALGVAAAFLQSGSSRGRSLCIASDDFGGRGAVVLGPATGY
jgi:3-oxoacyl-[acyl-carrier-protein] synthase-1